jgi:S-DNA-T family DNA segregation ATPase FtsK/SpoIIIE
LSVIERGLDSLSFLPDAVRDALHRRLRELGGLALIGLAILLAMALATWSVQDPSLSHATNKPVHNALGQYGAIVADLLMQLFGVASLALMLPIAIWGWRLASNRPMRRERISFAFWILGVLLAAACASALPRSTAWPLPAGLGGVVGDWMLRLPAWLAGGTLTGMVRTGVAVATGLGTLACLAITAGFGWNSDVDEDEDDVPAEDEREDHRKDRAWFRWAGSPTAFSLKARIGAAADRPTGPSRGGAGRTRPYRAALRRRRERHAATAAGTRGRRVRGRGRGGGRGGSAAPAAQAEDGAPRQEIGRRLCAATARAARRAEEHRPHRAFR